GQRFQAYGWQVQRINGMDGSQVAAAIESAKQETRGPSLIVARTHIGYGSPNRQDTPKAHGEPLGEDEVVLAKRFYGWPEDKHFYVPEEALAHFREALTHGARWQQ